MALRTLVPLELPKTELAEYDYWYWLDFIKTNSN